MALLTLILNFLEKKYLGHPKMTKIFFPQSIPFTSTWNFLIVMKNKKVIAIEVGLQDIDTIEGKIAFE